MSLRELYFELCNVLHFIHRQPSMVCSSDACHACQWIEVASELNLLYMLTTTIALYGTRRVGPENTLQIVRIGQKVYANNVSAKYL